MKILTKIKLITASLAVIILCFSCFKSEEYPLEPVISDPQVQVLGDSAVVSFSFTDGDADLGLEPSDTFGVHAPGSYYYYNIYLDYFEKDDSQGWVPGMDLSGDTIRFAYRIKPIEVSENTKGIKGTIDVDIQNFANPFSTQSDTVKFAIKLIDRALNESNVIETSEIITG
ncbi:MAG: hypothetical protein HUJ25_14825 [Crocinitomicaceae bacterium]|nr:hypothetical protein [Crocinitomicaceae bacterium]